MPAIISISLPNELLKVIDDLVVARKSAKLKKPPLTPEQLSEALSRAKVSLEDGQTYIDGIQSAEAQGKASRSSVIVDLLAATPEIKQALAPPDLKPKPKRTPKATA